VLRAAAWPVLLLATACSLTRDGDRFSAGAEIAGGSAGQTAAGSGGAGNGGATGGTAGAAAGSAGAAPSGCAVGLSARGETTCAVRSDGRVFCWGDNFYGQLGDGSKTNRTSPVAVEGFVGGVVQVATGGLSTCAVKGDGTLWCWGSNGSGQLGIPSTAATQTKPVKVPLESVSSVSAGNSHTCAVTRDGTTWCWGANANGMLGATDPTCSKCTFDGQTSDCCRSPIQVLPAGESVGVTAGIASCAWGEAGLLKCWGPLGGGSVPTEVTGIVGGAAQVSWGGAWHGAARSLAGGMWAWGFFGGGAFSSPVELEMKDASTPADVAAGAYHICMATADGLWCWGESCEGQRGDGTLETCTTGSGAWHPVPTRATNLEGPVARVAAGYAHTCAIKLGEVWCWGWNRDGQLGRANTRVPLPVDLACP
jgi:alpha-tubulin suppressor-like RCC1 family protein